MSRAYFAYRLPNENVTHYLSGEVRSYNSLDELDDNGIAICSFDRSTILMLKDLEEIDPQDFDFHQIEPKNESTNLATYEHSFKQVSEAINSGRFEKVVLSKIKLISKEINILSTFQNLNNTYSETFNYLLSSEKTGCWMGASPELLCHLKEGNIDTVSLAGTKIPDEKWTEKEILEQLYVTNYIADKLLKAGAVNLKENGPSTISAGPVDHLKTIITAKLDGSSWKSIIDQLHPTPATCGIPTGSSMRFIQEVEKHNRQLYTGFIGVFRPEEKRTYVNLRCMQIHKGSISLYLGGGIIAQSTLEKEWQETERKAITLERVMKYK